MSQRMLTMTHKELDRLALIQQCRDRKITQRYAAEVLGMTEQHLGYLIRRYEQEGVSGLISKHRGKPSNNRLSDELKGKAIQLIKQDFYDYGPTLAAEKLFEYHEIKISKETARTWMTEANIWHPFEKPPPKLHPCRERRACFGELLQIDGSDHPWFEARAPRCTLLVFIDDATSKIDKLFFCDDETTLNYFAALKAYVLRFGVPRSFYNDKHAVFKVNHPEAKSGNGLTQFGRVLDCLGVEEIFANSPQAKGRVERANRTLQNRLVKELRHHNISDIASANIFAEGFLEKYNKRFAIPPKNAVDLHRGLTEQEKQGLDRLFSIQINRVISKDMQVRHERTIYKINEPSEVRRLRQARVLVCVNIKGEVSIYHQDKALNYEVYRKGLHADQLLNRSGVNSYLNRMFEIERRCFPTQAQIAAKKESNVIKNET